MPIERTWLSRTWPEASQSRHDQLPLSNITGIQERLFHTIRIKIVLPFQSITEKSMVYILLITYQYLSHQSFLI
jgi:hypothetical protein